MNQERPTRQVVIAITFETVVTIGADFTPEEITSFYDEGSHCLEQDIEAYVDRLDKFHEQCPGVCVTCTMATVKYVREAYPGEDEFKDREVFRLPIVELL